MHRTKLQYFLFKWRKKLLKKIALVLKDYKQKNKIMKQIVNGMKKTDENVIVRDYYPESKIVIYDKNEFAWEKSQKIIGKIIKKFC